MIAICRSVLERTIAQKPLFNTRRPIFLSFPTVFQELSFIHGGLIEELICRGSKVVVLVNDAKKCEKFRRFFKNRVEISVEAAKVKIPKWKRLFFSRVSAARSYKNIRNLAPVAKKRIEKNTGFMVKLLSKVIPESVLVSLQNTFLTFPEHDRLFLKYKPGLVVLSDSGIFALNRHLARSGRKHGVPVIAAEQSIDDAERCSWLPELDASCVWGRDMKDEMMNYHGYSEDSLPVIGLLRGDIYKKESLSMKRDEFFMKEGLDRGKKLITIMTTSSAPKLFCDIAKAILRSSDEGSIPYPVQIYIRPTPYQCREKDRYLAEFLDNPRVRIGEPFPMQSEEVLSQAAVGLLANLVRYSDVLINTLSTLTLEACLVDVPVINVDFKEARHLFDYEYVKRILATGGTSRVKDIPELVAALNQYLENAAFNREGRQEIVKRFCHKDDGKATKRLLAILEEYAC